MDFQQRDVSIIASSNYPQKAEHLHSNHAMKTPAFVASIETSLLRLFPKF